MAVFHPGMRVHHPFFGLGKVSAVTDSSSRAKITVEFGDRSRRTFTASDLVKSLKLEPTFTERDLIPTTDEDEPLMSDQSGGISLRDVKRALREVLEEDFGFGEVLLADKWVGGEVEIKPLDESKQSKSIPIDTFFHKIVMVRDRLRVLEQKINANKNLSDDEKVELQQYITKVYGSLTTFNILFKEKDDHFRGERQ